MLRILGLTGCLAFGGCAGTTYPPASYDAFGDAVRHNRAVHIASPEVRDPRLPIPADGQRSVLTIERYREDRVEVPQTTAVSGVGPASAGAGAGAGSATP